MPPPCDGGWRGWVTDGVEPVKFPRFGGHLRRGDNVVQRRGVHQSGGTSDPRYTNVTPIRTARCAPSIRRSPDASAPPRPFYLDEADVSRWLSLDASG